MTAQSLSDLLLESHSRTNWRTYIHWSAHTLKDAHNSKSSNDEAIQEDEIAFSNIGVCCSMCCPGYSVWTTQHWHQQTSSQQGSLTGAYTGQWICTPTLPFPWVIVMNSRQNIMADRQMADWQMTSKIHQELMKWLTFLVTMKAVKTKLFFNIIFVFDLGCIIVFCCSVKLCYFVLGSDFVVAN